MKEKLNKIYISNIEKQTEDISFDNHGVFEASAGTGKTYAITVLIGRLIAQKRAKIHEILALTYTKKAAQELKDRIRERLEKEKEGEKNKEAKEALQDALDNFHQFSVGTIHSFCQNLLHEYPFETFSHFQFELGEEPEIYQKAFFRYVKKLNDNPSHLEKTLGLTVEAQEKVLIQVASLYDSNHFFLKGYQADLENFEKLKTAEKDLTHARIQKDKKAQKNIKEEVEKTKKSFFYPQIKEHIDFLQKESATIKNTQNLITYDDMLKKVHYAILNNPNFKRILQNRFKIALIDEFQDTDAIQWEIFKEIFVYPDAIKNGHCFFAVGDPKQAIYSFRGADLHTYFDAKEHLIENGGQFYVLNTNWRSSANLLKGFEALFAQSSQNGKEWFRNDFIDYPNLVPSSKTLDAQENIQQPICLVQVSSDKVTVGEAQDLYSHFIAQTILQLTMPKGIATNIPSSILNHTSHDNLASDSFNYTPDATKEKKYSYHDILILVRKRKEALPIQKALEKVGIPYTFYKEGGLFQTTQAWQLLAILEAMVNLTPKTLKKALLTQVFQFSLEDLEKIEEQSKDLNYYTQIIKQWEDLALKQKWPQFVFSLLYQTALLSKESLARSQANWVQLSQWILKNGLQEKGNLENLTHKFSELVHLSNTQEEGEDLLILETEESAVTIMTLHASKGLEAPVVFVAGGFSQGAENKFFQFHEEGKKVISFDSQEEDKEIEELQEEEQRLFYVGMTRAKERLYVPYVKEFSRLPNDPKRFLSFPFNKEFLTQWPEVCPHVKKIEIQPPAKDKENKTPEGLFLKTYPHFSFQKYSFSFDNKLDQEFSYSSIVGLEEESHPLDFSPFLEPENNFSSKFLPKGALTGNLVHEILEKFDFNLVQKNWLLHFESQEEAFAPLVQKHLRQSFSPSQYKNLYQALRDLIYNALSFPLFSKPDFALNQLKVKHILKESFFIGKAHLLAFQDPALKQGYTNGIIDLIFCYQDKIYLLDWKTDLLTQEQLADLPLSTIQKYGVQHEIYSKILKQNLSVSKGYQYGGMFYLYLRYLNKSSRQGVCFFDSQGNPQGEING